MQEGRANATRVSQPCQPGQDLLPGHPKEGFCCLAPGLRPPVIYVVPMAEWSR